MKKPLLITTTLVVLALSATSIYAQVASGTSIVDKMKAAVGNFTLSTSLNPDETGLQSAPIKGKKTGGILTAGEWNRVLELLAEGGGAGGGSGWVDVPLADTNPFEIDNCEYRFRVSGVGGNGVIPGFSQTHWYDVTYKSAGAIANAAWVYLRSGNKQTVYVIDTSNNSVLDVTAAWGWRVTNIQKKCNGGGGGGITTVTGGGLALYKCTNAQSADSTNAPCYGASRNGGAGTNQYRVISCTDNDGIRSYTMSSILNFGQLATNKWAVSVNGGTIECDDGTVLVMDTTGNSSSTSGMTSPVVKTKHKPTTSSSLTFEIPAGSRYATANVFGNAPGYASGGAEENHEQMEIFFDFQNAKSSGIHSVTIGNGPGNTLGYSWEGHAFGTRVTLKEGDDTLSTTYAIWANGVRPTVSVTGNQLTISGLSNQYFSQTWMVTFH